MLHKIIAILPSFFALYIKDPWVAAFLLYASSLTLGLYHGLSFDKEPYQGALSDIKTMWLIHILGIMLYTICRFDMTICQIQTLAQSLHYLCKP